jgi:methylenetetrahydrofolate reductase (NADPH)
MNNFVAGVSVPDEMIKRFPVIKKAMPDDEKAQARAESKEIGKKIAIELINQAREIPGVKGVHIQGIEWEEVVPEVVGGAGLLPRPELPDQQAE